jgi:hypothetical protein
MESIGPYLQAGWSFRKIAEMMQASEDFVSSLVADARCAIVEHVLSQPDLPPRLRERLTAETRAPAPFRPR